MARLTDIKQKVVVGGQSWMGRLLFGNTAGLKNNIRGTYRKQKESIQSTNITKVDSDFREQKFVNLGNPHDPELVREIRDKFDDYITDEEYYTERSARGYSRNLPNIRERIPEVQELLSPDLVEEVERHFGSSFEVVNIDMRRNYHVPEKVRKEGNEFANYWHCDENPTDNFKILVNINDTTESQGPLHVLPRHATKQIARAGYNRVDLPDDEAIKREGLDDEILRATGEAGTTVMASSYQCFHRAGIPDEGEHRDQLMLHFRAASEPLPEDWLSYLDEHNDHVDRSQWVE